MSAGAIFGMCMIPAYLMFAGLFVFCPWARDARGLMAAMSMAAFWPVTVIAALIFGARIAFQHYKELW